MKCRERTCRALALDDGELCDPHQEQRDEGKHLRMKPAPKPHDPTMALSCMAKAAQREAIRAILRAEREANPREVPAKFRAKPQPPDKRKMEDAA